MTIYHSVFAAFAAGACRGLFPPSKKPPKRRPEKKEEGGVHAVHEYPSPCRRLASGRRSASRMRTNAPCGARSRVELSLPTQKGHPKVSLRGRDSWTRTNEMQESKSCALTDLAISLCNIGIISQLLSGVNLFLRFLSLIAK